MSEENKLEAIQEEQTVAPEELSEQELNEIDGGADKTKDEETIRNAWSEPLECDTKSRGLSPLDLAGDWGATFDREAGFEGGQKHAGNSACKPCGINSRRCCFVGCRKWLFMAPPPST